MAQDDDGGGGDDGGGEMEEMEVDDHDDYFIDDSSEQQQLDDDDGSLPPNPYMSSSDYYDIINASPPPKKKKKVKFERQVSVRDYFTPELSKREKPLRKVVKKTTGKKGDRNEQKKEIHLKKIFDKTENVRSRLYSLKKLKVLADNRKRLLKLNSGNNEALTDEEGLDISEMEAIIKSQYREAEESKKKQHHKKVTNEEKDEKEVREEEKMKEEEEDKKTVYLDDKVMSVIQECERMSDVKAAQELLDETVINRPYLVITENGSYCRRTISEVKEPNESVATYRRFCNTCAKDISLEEWEKHLRSEYHQVRFKALRLFTSFCWINNVNRKAHNPSMCNECLYRYNFNLKYKDTIENFLYYKKEDDKEYKEMTETLDKLAKLNEKEKEKWFCKTCEVRCFSDEFFQKHLDGKKHRTKIEETTKKRKRKEEEGENNPKKQKKQEDNQKKRKRENEGGEKQQPPSKKHKGQVTTIDSSSEKISEIIENGEKRWQCNICELVIKYKKNIKSHLKSKKHADAKKDKLSTSDETAEEVISKKDDIPELSFCRKNDDSSGARKGHNFMLEFNHPVKYKIGKRVTKFMYSCKECLKYFRTAGRLRRHKESEQHKIMSQKYIIINGEKIERKVYPTRKRLQVEQRQSLFESTAISNEFSVTKDRIPHSHSHMYVRTTDAHLFKDMKRLLWTHFNVKPNDIQRPINIRECVRYITKQDSNAIVINIPLKYTSTIYKAQLYRDHGNTQVNWGDYIPSQVSSSERKIFDDNVKQEQRLLDGQVLAQRIEGLRLRPWQEEVLGMLNEFEGDERAVIWFVDYDGGMGKSKLCQYLASERGAAIYHDLEYKNNSYIYRSEKYVLFDLPRGYTMHDMRFIEDLKNGILCVAKYESKSIIFHPPVVVVFSNSEPNLELLSMDRWHVFTIQRGPLYVTPLLL